MLSHARRRIHDFAQVQAHQRSKKLTAEVYFPGENGFRLVYSTAYVKVLVAESGKKKSNRAASFRNNACEYLGRPPRLQSLFGRSRIAAHSHSSARKAFSARVKGKSDIGEVLPGIPT